jgi:hypothetical protein
MIPGTSGIAATSGSTGAVMIWLFMRWVVKCPTTT